MENIPPIGDTVAVAQKPLRDKRYGGDSGSITMLIRLSLTFYVVEIGKASRSLVASSAAIRKKIATLTPKTMSLT
jgi:hypothetical protein